MKDLCPPPKKNPEQEYVRLSFWDSNTLSSLSKRTVIWAFLAFSPHLYGRWAEEERRWQGGEKGILASGWKHPSGGKGHLKLWSASTCRLDQSSLLILFSLNMRAGKNIYNAEHFALDSLHLLPRSSQALNSGVTIIMFNQMIRSHSWD